MSLFLFNMSVLGCSLKAKWNVFQNNDVSFLIVILLHLSCNMHSLGALCGTNPSDDTDNTDSRSYVI